ncbi:MAG: bifunctional metallophosphatase/5'-nucleotidase, partial [Lachnospiraceae bacterium]|nr:bifunctional metallophosphatase/5'-nucleotidase [Lachnospiraceae bacterium]
FIGLLTESIAERIRQEEIVDSAVSVRSAFGELKKVFEELKEDPADITILLTHLGIEEDKPLAERLDPDWDVDFIIGGHSHTFLEEPVRSGGTPIVQAGFGSDQIGRFDLTWDRENRKLADWSWQLVPINEETSEEDPLVSFYHDRFRTETDRKYDRTLFSLAQAYTHPGFHRETQLGDLYADIYQAIYHTDVFFLSTNVIWAKELGPAVTRRDLMISFPYENAVYELTMTGERLLALIRYVYRPEAWEGANIFFLFSGTLRLAVRAEDKEILSASLHGGEIAPDAGVKVGITGYAYKNRETFLGIRPEEEEDGTARFRRLSVNDREDMESWLSGCGELSLTGEGRLAVITE